MDEGGTAKGERQRTTGGVRSADGRSVNGEEPGSWRRPETDGTRFGEGRPGDPWDSLRRTGGANDTAGEDGVPGHTFPESTPSYLSRESRACPISARRGPLIHFIVRLLRPMSQGELRGQELVAVRRRRATMAFR